MPRRGAAALYIGLMSGTSLDGIDGVLVDFATDPLDPAATGVHVLAHEHAPYPPDLADALLALNATAPDELHRAALAANALARAAAEVVRKLLAGSAVAEDRVSAIASHGQTVRHRPREFDGTGYTIQLNNPALLAELTGIDVIADFRTRDVAAGGQGAPLVPSFHRAVFASRGRDLAVLNIGGIANISVLRGDGSTIGYDCGPGNALMDAWCLRHRGARYDAGGAWARSGRVDAALLVALRADDYFAVDPPKSTGRDRYNEAWLDARLFEAGSAIGAADVQATLAELTASTCADAVEHHAPAAERVLVCGGGAHNAHLLQRLAALLAGRDVTTTDAAGLPAQQVEACAFAWLARAWRLRLPGNVAAVTGAAGPRVLGALYPAS